MLLHPLLFAGILKPLFVIISSALVGFLLLSVFDRPLFNLAVLLFRIDLTAFGGGFASIPLMLHEIVDVHHWMDRADLHERHRPGSGNPRPDCHYRHFYRLSVAGASGWIGCYHQHLPAVISIGDRVSPFFDRLRSSSYFNKAILGVLCSFVGLLFTVIFRFAGNVQWNYQLLLLSGAALVALFV